MLANWLRRLHLSYTHGFRTSNSFSATIDSTTNIQIYKKQKSNSFTLFIYLSFSKIRHYPSLSVKSINIRLTDIDGVGCVGAPFSQPYLSYAFYI